MFSMNPYVEGNNCYNSNNYYYSNCSPVNTVCYNQGFAFPNEPENEAYVSRFVICSLVKVKLNFPI